MIHDTSSTTPLPQSQEMDRGSLDSSVLKFVPISASEPRRDSLSQIIREQQFFADLNEDQLRVVRELAMEVHYGPDVWIFREGDPANRFFIILKGYVSVEVEYSGQTMPIRTLGPGDDLGWAWLFAPYYMHFSARTTGPVRAIFFYGTRLRDACEQDHELGYRLMKRVAQILVQNLSATQRRFLETTENNYD
jgi:CRP-like cAMP-binding protein